MSRVIKFRAYIDGKMIPWSPGFFSDCSPVTGYGSDFPEGDDCKLMQFTGFQDKNGVDIYENDLVLVRDNRICEVIFHKHAGCLDLKLISALSSVSVGCVSPASYKYHTEVVGNIYQNPDLLTK